MKLKILIEATFYMSTLHSVHIAPSVKRYLGDPINVLHIETRQK